MNAFDVWRYVRVSTSDKGQDPKRQEQMTDAWSAREGPRIVGTTVDEGTSATFTDPFERENFRAACREAKAHACAGIVAETVDRVCGQGSDELGWTRYELKRRFGLQLFLADVPLSMHGTLGGNVTTTANAEVRRERIALDRRRIREGIASRRARGLPVGGATQSKVSEEFVLLVAQIHDENPRWGLRRIAHEASKRRGWTGVSDSPEQRARRVTHGTVAKALRVIRGRRGGSST